jgi:hypothetical protein
MDRVQGLVTMVRSLDLNHPRWEVLGVWGREGTHIEFPKVLREPVAAIWRTACRGRE